MFTWTETPLVEMWRQIRYLSSPANVVRLLDGSVRSGRDATWRPVEALQDRAYGVAACIRQADEYYTAAETVDLATRPLLQFYGAECLAKAAILCSLADVSINDVNYHGLASRPSKVVLEPLATELHEYRADPSKWAVEREFAIVHPEGVLRHLCRALGASLPSVGQVFFLKDLLRVVPDLAELYSRHYRESSWCFYLSGKVERDGDGHLQMNLSRLQNAKAALEEVPGLLQDFDCTTRTAERVSLRSLGVLDNLPEYLTTVEGTVAGTYLVRCLDGGLVHSASVLFSGLFIIGNLVRYKPSFWMREIDSRGSGAVAIVEAFCNAARRRFPNDVLSLIWKESFEYGTPGRLS